MADKETTLGPSATYLGNFEGDKQSVTMAGVFFKPGKAVNLVDELGAQRANAMLTKLAGNTFFKVDNGPDHAKAQKARERSREEAQTDQREAEEERIAKINAPDEATLERQQQRNGGRKQAS